MTKMPKSAREPRSGNRAQRHCKKKKSLPCSYAGGAPTPLGVGMPLGHRKRPVVPTPILDAN